MCYLKHKHKTGISYDLIYPRKQATSVQKTLFNFEKGLNRKVSRSYACKFVIGFYLSPVILLPNNGKLMYKTVFTRYAKKFIEGFPHKIRKDRTLDSGFIM